MYRTSITVVCTVQALLLCVPYKHYCCVYRTSITVVCTVQEYLRTPIILFGTGYILRRVYIIFRLSLILCYFLLPLISFYTSVSRVSFHSFIRCLLLSFWRCNVQGTLTAKVISHIICLCWFTIFSYQNTVTLSLIDYIAVRCVYLCD